MKFLTSFSTTLICHESVFVELSQNFVTPSSMKMCYRRHKGRRNQLMVFHSHFNLQCKIHVHGILLQFLNCQNNFWESFFKLMIPKLYIQLKWIMMEMYKKNPELFHSCLSKGYSILNCITRWNTFIYLGCAKSRN